MTTGTIEKKAEAAANVAESVLNKAESAEEKVLDAVDNAQNIDR